MNIRLYIPIFATTLLISAALLFSVQPMFSKMILPLLGGTPQVWNTAMLFFQAILLAGYAYAHGTSRFLSIPVQATIHIILLIVCVVFLPLAIPDGWKPPVDNDPTLWQLAVMGVSVGGPFFVIAGSAPMLQHWFSATPHPDADNPYFLYGASNLGSIAALLLYPVLFEPLMSLSGQSLAWSFVYGVLIVFTALAAFVTTRNRVTAVKETKDSVGDHTSIGWKLRLTWVFWAFVPSSMMLGVTTYITTDIASAPLLWIIPLALYVGSFILVFSRRQIFSDRFNTSLMFVGLCFILLTSIALKNIVHSPFLLTGIHFTFFFIAAIACHKRLVDLRPSPSHLTEFYLLMSVGGVLGGFFNAIIAPQFFTSTIEYPIAIGLACFARYSWQEDQSLRNSYNRFVKSLKKDPLKTIFNERHLIAAFVIIGGIIIYNFPTPLLGLLLGGILIILLADSYSNRWLSTFLIIFLLCLFPPSSDKIKNSNLLFQERNFFGVIRVLETDHNTRTLLHGTTNHGIQSRDEKYKLLPLSYYGADSPLRDGISLFDNIAGTQEFAVIGLGSGATACYQKQGRHFDLFEIDPSIARVAQNPEYFTYLQDCGKPYEIILGDGRLTIQDKPDNYYDFILLDAFSSDSIPVHLITLEAIEIYMRKLKPNGVILFHISNRHLDLEPVLSMAAQKLGIKSLAKVSDGSKVADSELEYYPTHYVAFTRSTDYVDRLIKDGWSETNNRAGIKLWTDQYSNILSVFGANTTHNRFDTLKKMKAGKDGQSTQDGDLETAPTSSP